MPVFIGIKNSLNAERYKISWFPRFDDLLDRFFIEDFFLLADDGVRQWPATPEAQARQVQAEDDQD